MARNFTSATDKITVPNLAGTTLSTVCGWAKNPVLGSASQQGKVWNGRASLYFRSTSENLRFSRTWSTTSGIWECTSANLGVNVADWNHYAWVYDGNSTSNVPTLYVNGVLNSNVTTITSPVGTITNTGAAHHIGNNGGDTEVLSGDAAMVSVYDVLLTQGEVIEVMLFGFAPRGLLRFYPLYGEATEYDLSGNIQNATTITGTAVVAGPPMAPRLFPITLSAAPRRVPSGNTYSLAVNRSSASTTPDIAAVLVARALIGARTSTSTTPDTAALISLVAFIMNRSSTSTTPDTVAAQIARAILFAATSAGITSNTADLVTDTGDGYPFDSVATFDQSGYLFDWTEGGIIANFYPFLQNTFPVHAETLTSEA